MSIRVGANPIGWTNDDLQDIGGDTPLETCLAEAKEAGVVGMEKGHKLPSDGAALKDKLGHFGLTFVGGWYSAELLKRSARDEFKAAKSHIAMTKGAGTDVRASAARHRTCTLGGADPAALARAYRARIGHVHCKDVREAKMRESNAGDWSFLNSILGQGKELGVYTVPGDGAIDYVSVFDELKGYSGWVVLEAEQDPKKAPALPYAQKGVAHIRTALKEAGLA
jgi:sugar phosphate isomerase/epimerase